MLNFTYEPEKGNMIELGVKAKIFDEKFTATLAIYEINMEDVLANNPLDTGDEDDNPAYLSSPGVESRGLEITLEGDLTPDWTFTANYAYNNIEAENPVEGERVYNGTGNAVDGSVIFANAPEHQAGFWTRYDLKGINSAFSFGAEYVGERYTTIEQRIKPWVVFDTGWITYLKNGMEIQVNIKNLFDEVYAVSGFNIDGHFPGAPREFIARLRYSF